MKDPVEFCQIVILNAWGRGKLDSHGSLGNLGVGKLLEGGQKGGRDGVDLKETCFAIVSTEHHSNYPEEPGVFWNFV